MRDLNTFNNLRQKPHDTEDCSVFTSLPQFFCLFVSLFCFLAVLGFRCCTWAFSSCGERGLLFVVVHGLSHYSGFFLVAEHGL